MYTLKYDTIQCNALQYNAMQSDTIRYDTKVVTINLPAEGSALGTSN